MPTLIKQQDGEWAIIDSAPEPWQTRDEWAPPAGLKLDVDDEPSMDFTQASRIAVQFPAFNDGRGLSLAVLLRTRFDYKGELWATGAVHEDLLHYMARCGFTAFEFPDDRDAEVALAQLQPYSDHYQGSVVEPAPAFRRVTRGVRA